MGKPGGRALWDSGISQQFGHYGIAQRFGHYGIAQHFGIVE